MFVTGMPYREEENHPQLVKCALFSGIPLGRVG
jgi:hypothetical protein